MNLLQFFYPTRREPLGHLSATHFREKQPPRRANSVTSRPPSWAGGPRQRPAPRDGVSLTTSQVSRQLPPASGAWGTAALAEFLADLFLAAEWLLGGLYLLDGLRELFWQPRPAAKSPLESTTVLAAALLEDHAYCLALLTTELGQPLSAARRDDLLYRHRRMVWMLHTYLAKVPIAKLLRA